MEVASVYGVRFSPRAVDALGDIRRYISKNNPSLAWVVAYFITILPKLLSTERRREIRDIARPLI